MSGIRSRRLALFFCSVWFCGAAGGGDDLAPRRAAKANGVSWTIWWRDLESDRVLFRKLDHENGWTRMRPVSGELKDARHPEIAIIGNRPWVSYESADPAGTAPGSRRRAPVVPAG